MRLALSVLLLLGSVVGKKRHHSESDEEETTQSPAEKVVDRLAVNLAGAFVKSMFPEMDRSESPAKSEIRRVPASPSGLDPSMENYNTASAMKNYNSIPQMGQMHQTPNNPFAYQGNVPYPQPTGGAPPSVGAMDIPNMSQLLTAGSGTPEALNAVRNQQYLQELTRHQTALNSYAAKQSEYLENQRRYQQAMIDHQAGAALLLQQQQQQAINDQMKQLKAAYGSNDHFSEDNTVGGRVLTRKAHGVKSYEPQPPKQARDDDDINTNDAHLRRYFKEQYGIDFDTHEGKLTADERDTLRQLKAELLKNKERAIDRGAFKEMDNLKGKVKKSRHSSSERLASAPKGLGDTCAQCIPMNLKMLRGAWTQMYGNPAVVKKTFGTILSLESHDMTGKASWSKRRTSCVGMEVGRAVEGESTLNIFFRDDSSGNPLHEMRGVATINGDEVSFDTDRYNTKMCLVKAGPSESERYEYVVLAETTGNKKCKSYHVFARNTDEFNRRHFDDISEFMKAEVMGSEILPMGAIPKASLCQLDRP